MKAQVGKARILPWFDVNGVAVDSTLLTAKIYSGATLLHTFTSLDNLAGFADAYATDEYTFSTAGSYLFVILYDGTVVDSAVVEASHEVVPTFPLGQATKPVLLLQDYEPGADMSLCVVTPDGVASDDVNVVYQSARYAYEAENAVTVTQRGACQIIWKAVVSAVLVPVRLQDVWVGTEVGYETVTFIARVADTEDSAKHEGATVVVSDAQGVQLAQGVTGSDGAVSLSLLPGEVVASLIKDGVVFSTNNFNCTIVNTLYAPDDENVYPLVTTSFSPTRTPIPTPAPMCTLEATLLQVSGAALRHADVRVSVLSYPRLTSGAGIVGNAFTVKTDSNGYVSFDLVRGALIEVAIPAASLRRIVTVPAEAGPVNLFELVSAAEDVFNTITITPPAAPRRTL